MIPITRRGIRVSPALAAALLCGASARAQRNGDVQGGMDNQPTQGEVRSRERAAGVTPPPADQKRETGTVDQVYRNLMSEERADGIMTAPADPNAPLSPAPASAGRCGRGIDPAAGNVGTVRVGPSRPAPRRTP